MQITMQPIKRKRRPTLVPLMYLLPAVLLVVVFVYYPVVNNLWLSLFRWSAFSPQDIWVGLGNYQELMKDSIFWTGIRNNVAYAVVSLIFQVGGAMVLAAILEEAFVRRFRVFFRTVYFLPAVISMTVVGLLFTFLYDPQMGLIDQLLTVTGHASWVRAWLGNERTAIWAIIAMSQWQSIGYITLLFVVAMQRIPRELYEAAAMDGANGIRIFFQITVPLVREMTLLASIITVSGAFMVFNEVMVTTQGGPNNASHVLATWMYQSAFMNDQMGYASAIATIIFLITFGLAIVQLWIGRSGQTVGTA
jgi:raffinose/stachyose/melibiose transport system permease protein